MPNPVDKIKPAVRAIKAYTLPPYRASIKINQNENPWDLPDEIKEEASRRLAHRHWSRYPDFVPTSLLERLAAFAGWKPEGTLAGNGSNELIQATLMVCIGPGSRVLLSEPTFTLYRQIVTVMGGETVAVSLTPDFQFDFEAIRRRINGERIDLIIFCSPNNPTGSSARADQIRQLGQEFDGLIVIDEAYHEFSDQSMVSLLNELPNLIVLRTFSKAMAMAGLRVGYLLSSPDLVREVHKGTLPYNLNFFSQTVAEVACERYELLEASVDAIKAERTRLYGELTTIKGVEVVPLTANFMLLRTPVAPRLLFEDLLARDILVRDVSSYPMLSEYIRVSVGLPNENDQLIAALAEVIQSRTTAGV